MIGAIILAAGRSTRMGRSKPLLPHGPAGETLLKHQVETLRTAGFRHILVVGQPDDRPLHDEVARCGIGLALNPRADAGGQLSSLQVGLRTVEEAFGSELEGVLVMPTDVPFVSSTG